MTDQPVEPRERETEQNPAVTTPQPDPEPGSDDDEAEQRREALDGSDVGSDTRAGSLQGGSATGSERDDAQAASDRHLAGLGPSLKAAPPKGEAPEGEPSKGVNNTGAPKEQAQAPGDDADTPTG
jgi:hypothetical protein